MSLSEEAAKKAWEDIRSAKANSRKPAKRIQRAIEDTVSKEVERLERELSYAARWASERLNDGFARCPEKDMTPEYMRCYWKSMSWEENPEE